MTSRARRRLAILARVFQFLAHETLCVVTISLVLLVQLVSRVLNHLRVRLARRWPNVVAAPMTKRDARASTNASAGGSSLQVRDSTTVSTFSNEAPQDASRELATTTPWNQRTMPNAHFPLSVRGSTTTTTELIATMEALQTRLVALQKGQPSATGPCECNVLLRDAVENHSTLRSPAVLYVRIRELARHIEALELERRRLSYQ